MAVLLGVWVAVGMCGGCGQGVPGQPTQAASNTPPKAVAPRVPAVPVVKAGETKQFAPAAAQPKTEQRAQDERRRRAERGALEELLKKGRAARFDLPRLDDERIAAAGIRKLVGQHIVIYTDLPATPDVDELPSVFDAAVPRWCDYFDVAGATVERWQIVGSVMRAKERFLAAGLYTEDLPDFPSGFNRGSQLWLYEQPSAYFRRHQLLHEGTHGFMERWLGDAGPPWYAEGMAEMLGTHRWKSGELTMGVMPGNKEDFPYWGRIKTIKDEFAAARGMALIDILQYGNRGQFQDEAYSWCWAAAAFFDRHPHTQAAFRALKSDAQDISLEFSQRFFDKLREHWPQIAEDWQVFVADCDYGYDVARAAVVRQEAVDLPPDGATVSVAADRGWQSSGFRLAAGKGYVLTASGRFQLAAEPKPWPCEAGGVTMRYAGGKPVGMLLASLSDLDGMTPVLTPLATPQPIGLGGEIQPERAGTLYLKINEPASGLSDNSGNLTVTIRPR